MRLRASRRDDLPGQQHKIAIEVHRAGYLAWVAGPVDFYLSTSTKNNAKNGERHYDIGRELHRRMLDKRMIYGCACWKDLGDICNERDKRMRDYYLLSFAGVFRSQASRFWQIVLTSPGSRWSADRCLLLGNFI